MTFMALPVVVLLLIMPIGLLGIVLFIVGLVKKKPAMWGSGIAVAVLGLMVVVVGAGMLMFFSASSASSRMMTVQGNAVSAAMADSFYETTGLILPNGASVTSQSETYSLSSGSNGPTRVILHNLSVPVDFDGFLAANFTKAQWSDVAPTFQAFRSNNQSFLPSDNRLQAASLYVLTYRPDPDLPETFVTAVAHDAEANQAWMVSVETPAPVTQP